MANQFVLAKYSVGTSVEFFEGIYKNISPHPAPLVVVRYQIRAHLSNRIPRIRHNTRDGVRRRRSRDILPLKHTQE